MWNSVKSEVFDLFKLRVKFAPDLFEIRIEFTPNLFKIRGDFLEFPRHPQFVVVSKHKSIIRRNGPP